MERCGNYAITYHNMDNKTIVGTFLEEVNDMYLFMDFYGKFAISKSKIENNEISIELIEE